jgi:hypothetical protein
MAIDIKTTEGSTSTSAAIEQHFYRFHVPHLHLQSVFGDDWFALKAEAFARFFGTPRFLICKFQHEGTREAIWVELHTARRERMGREASPSAAILNSQPVK